MWYDIQDWANQKQNCELNIMRGLNKVLLKKFTLSTKLSILTTTDPIIITEAAIWIL